MRPLFARSAAASIGLAALSPLALAAAGSSPAGAASTPAQSAQSEYQAAIKATGNQGVHFVSNATQGGVTIRVAGDTGATSGAQTLSVTNGKLTEHVSSTVVGSTGYVSANSTALHNVIGLSNSQSTKYANKWLSFPTSNQGLDELVSGLLNSQISDELQMSGPYTYGTATTIGGQHVTAIRGTVSTDSGSKVPVILYVPSSGKPRPIEELTNPGASSKTSSIHGTVTFTNWGEKTSEKAPTHTVSLLKLAPPSTSTTTTTG